MPAIDASTLFNRLEATGLLPLFNHADEAKALGIARTLAEAGCPALEWTHRSSNALEVFRLIQREMGSAAKSPHCGAGSVLDAATAVAYIESGAAFIVAPAFVQEVADACRQRSIPYIPGIMTPTEAQAAHRAGCPWIKLFPAASVGPGHLRAMLGPCPWLRIMPTGGVNMEPGTIQAWFQAGAVCLGGGSEWISKDLVEASDWAGLAARIREGLALIAKHKRH